MSPHVFSIGHSTHALDEFVGLLARHDIGLLADVRRFPGSRRHPHFNQEALIESLPQADIAYRWFERLGGRRGKAKSPTAANAGLRNESFRNYADYMQTAGFAAAIDELLTAAADRPTAVMCSEGLFWRCHRRLVSDYLFGRGIVVEHILPAGETQPHALTKEARLVDGVPVYPAAGDDEPNRLLF